MYLVFVWLCFGVYNIQIVDVEMILLLNMVFNCMSPEGLKVALQHDMKCSQTEVAYTNAKTRKEWILLDCLIFIQNYKTSWSIFETDGLSSDKRTILQ